MFFFLSSYIYVSYLLAFSLCKPILDSQKVKSIGKQVVAIMATSYLHWNIFVHEYTHIQRYVKQGKMILTIVLYQLIGKNPFKSCG